MGRMGAEPMVEQGVSLELAISWQLQSNHYPPVPASMVPVCIEAIEVARSGDWDSTVELPEGITYKGSTEAPVYAIIEQHHLEPWINTEEYE